MDPISNSERKGEGGRILFIIIYIQVSLYLEQESLWWRYRLLGKMILHKYLSRNPSLNRPVAYACNLSTQGLQEDCCESEACLDDRASTRPDRNILSKDKQESTADSAYKRQGTCCPKCGSGISRSVISG